MEAIMPVSQCKLLLVEVDPQLLEARTSLLAQNGYEVSTASTLTSALRLFRSYVFDLLVIGPSVEERERTAMAAISKRINPKARVLAMVGENQKQPLADGWMTSNKESDILDAVAALLSPTENRRSSAAA
jgi:DNA-binding NtrC family response regulator